MARLTLKNLTLAYDGRPVISRLSLSVDNGDYLCVVGENGSGKSTLIKGILGLVKPQTGSIDFCCSKHRKSIGYLPQQQSSQRDFPASVNEVIMSGFAGKCRFPWYNADMKEKAINNMRLLKIENLKNEPFSSLSGGQQQRVLLARALCATEDLLLLDEPVNGLDPNAAKEMYSIIKNLNNDGMTVIMISHDVHTAVSCANKILHLDKDRQFYGTTNEYLLSDFGKEYLEGGAK